MKSFKAQFYDVFFVKAYLQSTSGSRAETLPEKKGLLNHVPTDFLSE